MPLAKQEYMQGPPHPREREILNKKSNKLLIIKTTSDPFSNNIYSCVGILGNRSCKYDDAGAPPKSHVRPQGMIQ